MTKEQINKLNELSNKFGESQSNNVFDIMEAARCYRVGYRAGFEDAKEEMNKHVDQATDLVFSACDRSNAVVDKLMSKNDQITELTRKLEVAKKIAKEAIKRIDCLPTCRSNSDSWLVKCSCGADKKAKELREALNGLE